MRPTEFFSLAQELAENNTEPHWRSAISRAYYGVFHITRNSVSKKTIVPRKDVHQFLKKYLDNHVDRKLGQKLGDLHGQRTQADYDIGKRYRTFTKRDAEVQVGVASRLATAIQETI